MADGDNSATNAVDPNSLAALLQQTMQPNSDVQTQNAPITGDLQAPPPTQQPQVSSTPPRSNQPPRMGGMPLLAQYIQGMIKGGNQGGIGPSGYPQQPQSRGDMTLNFLGEFLGNMAQGLSQAGHGPGANLRGFGAAVQAPYQRNLQDFQVQQQAQQQQAQLGLEQARTQAQVAAYTAQPRFDPQSRQFLGVMTDAQYTQYLRGQGAAGLNVQGRKDITGANIASREKIAGENIASKEWVAAKSLAEKTNEFKTTQDYRVWKEKLDKDTQLKVAQLTAGKAPATLFQTATFANGGLKTLNDAQQLMDTLEAKGVFGKNVAQNKVEDWIFGKGLVDPSLDPITRRQIGQLRNALDLTASAMQKAHTGRGMKEMYDDFKKTHGAGQDWEVLRGAMDESKDLLTDYSGVASDENIRRMRGGVAPVPKGGGAKQYSPDNPFAPKK